MTLSIQKYERTGIIELQEQMIVDTTPKGTSTIGAVKEGLQRALHGDRRIIYVDDEGLTVPI